MILRENNIYDVERAGVVIERGGSLEVVLLLIVVEDSKKAEIRYRVSRVKPFLCGCAVDMKMIIEIQVEVVV